VKWLLDTNVVSETVRPRPSRDVMRWLVEQVPEDTGISLVTLAELQHGVMLIADDAHRAELTQWVDGDVLRLFADRILPITQDVTITWLELVRNLSRRRQTRAPPDLLIAATARIHKLSVATRNLRDFANTGITVYNPWTNETQKMEAP
jgi:predicted nucleic acid-binding protein